MASASPNTASTGQNNPAPQVANPLAKATPSVQVLAPPGLLRCLILSWNDVRAEGLRLAAQQQAWEALVCSNSTAFIKQLFRLKVPLTIVDLPEVTQKSYPKMRLASSKVRDVSDSLLVVSAATNDECEEVWARELGAWAYLPEVIEPSSVEWVFKAAREALARQASAALEPQSVGQSIDIILRTDSSAEPQPPPKSGDLIDRGGDRTNPFTTSRSPQDGQQKN